MAGWSVDSLTEHLLGVMNQDRNTAGGTVPDRFKDIVRECLREIWEEEDWRFKIAVGTLTVAAAATTAALPDDYDKMATVALKDVDEAQWLVFTDNVARWQQRSSGYDSTDDGHPVQATILYDTDETCNWLCHITPPSDDDYSLKFPYIVRCPLDLATSHASYKRDSDVIPMPAGFHRMWRAKSLYELRDSFTDNNESTSRAGRNYGRLHDKAMAKHNETMKEPVGQTVSGYGDEAMFGNPGRYSDARRLPGDVF